MEFKDFVYLSDRKINQMYSQLSSQGAVAHFEVTGEASIGVTKAGVKYKGVAPADSVEKLQHLVEHLKKTSQLGSIGTNQKYFIGTIEAYCLLLGSNVFFLGYSPRAEASADARITLGLSCSLEHMIGGGYESTESLHELASPRGKAKGYGVKWTSSNVGFAQALMRDPDRIEDRRQQLDELRAAWREKYKITDEDSIAINRRRFANRAIEVLHSWSPPNTARSSAAFWGFKAPAPWPPEEPQPYLALQRPSRLMTWILGPGLYEAKVTAMNKRRQLSQAIERTNLDPLQIEVLREIRAYANDRRPPVQGYHHVSMIRQSYQFLAIRLAQATMQEEPVVLASPLYVALP